jgi:hypothetical protein
MFGHTLAAVSTKEFKGKNNTAPWEKQLYYTTILRPDN